MNMFYYNSRNDNFEKIKPCKVHDVYLTEIRTNKSFDDFLDSYDDYRKKGCSTIDSISLAI